jgi:dTDP-4-amino-4,6-dideoxygalactose transaminase
MIIDFSKPTIGSDESSAVQEVIESGWYTHGEKTQKFEKEFADYVGARYAILTNSCTSALKMAYKYANKQLGLKSFTYPLNTFCATYSSGFEMGLKGYPNRFDDSRIDIGTLMHYGGVKSAKANHRFIIEDSAHRIEQSDPLLGQIRCYSFHATKNMTTGSGGMFVTNQKRIYDHARIYWNDGIKPEANNLKPKNYRVSTLAGGYDGNEIMASFGLVQLAKLPEFTKKRNRIVKIYNQAFGQNWEGNHIYPFFVESEKKVHELINFLSLLGIQTSYHYPETGWLGVSLPIYPDLTQKELDYIIKSVLAWKNKSPKNQPL